MGYVDGCRRYRDELVEGELMDEAALATAAHGVWVPILGSRGLRVSALARWWKGPIEVVNGALVSRLQLVKTMANQDGGAHVDPEIDADYLTLSQDNRGNYHTKAIQLSQTIPTTVAADAWLVPGGTITAASMRQVAWELEQSIGALNLEWLQLESTL
jgi:hypothetical protein